MKPNAYRSVEHIRRILQDLRRGGDRPRAAYFFKEPVKRHGWRTADLRRYAARMPREIEAVGGSKVLFDVADKLFHAKKTGEEAHAAIMLLDPQGRRLLRGKASFLGGAHFRRLDRWIDGIVSWDACDDLCHSVMGRMIVSDSHYVQRAFAWAGSRSRWSRRAACVALVHRPALAWYVLTAIDIVTALLLWIYDKTIRPDSATPPPANNPVVVTTAVTE